MGHFGGENGCLLLICLKDLFQFVYELHSFVYKLDTSVVARAVPVRGSQLAGNIVIKAMVGCCYFQPVTEHYLCLAFTFKLNCLVTEARVSTTCLESLHESEHLKGKLAFIRRLSCSK